ncbi:flavodoxin family protein [uncultured Dysosmobacter sp.]|uniref:flavodoxin family protein n=1 Tax=uncultured Dysosmobacter sp. TaxID=2591384 RepID=UPI00263593B8|nr:flavodoxin family protein [uncultured Dysosmobacter sp.]
MSKNVLIITASLRPNSNSDALATSFAQGAKEAGNNLETVSLKGKSIGFCVGCLACQKTQKCVIRDDAATLAEKVKNADAVVFATPVYYYGPSGLLKAFLDRCNPIYPSDYAFRDVYFLATAADTDESAMDGPVKAMEGWVDCFGKARLAGTVFGGGVDAPGQIAGHEALQRAYEMGRQV